MTRIDPTKMDADLLREIARNVEAATPGFPTEYQGKLRTWARRLNALLPDPAPRTLAELIEAGHAPEEYQWVQAEHRDKRCIIVRMDGHASQPTVSLLTATGATIWTSTDEVIPLPDLPRLVWPASEQETDEETPTPEVHLAPGGVLIQEALDKLNIPEPQVGEAWLVSTREGEQREALKAGNRWYVKDGDDVEEWVEEALTPIARLVPEVKP